MLNEEFCVCLFFHKHDKSSIYEENAIHYPFNGRSVYDCLCCKKAQERLPEYLQAEKYTQEKLNTMLFSTVVDPWFQKGNNFWFGVQTSEGTFWYVVDPVARTKKLLFDRDELFQLTEIVKDPFEARHFTIINLKAKEDGRTFTFEVKSTKDANTKDRR